jgi:NADH-quinone oxidoreductase subunit L
MRVDVMTTLCLLLFIGAMGKSAQLGLHTWLPDAMEGPTPGLRADPRRHDGHGGRVHGLPPVADVRNQPTRAHGRHLRRRRHLPLFAATVGTVQNDIKRVIAYSTCSQLGYMFFAAASAPIRRRCSTSSRTPSSRPCCSSARLGDPRMHHEQDMRFYGGLRKSIPLTFWAMLRDAAITGVGVIGRGFRFGFAGFFSKDAIIESAFHERHTAGGLAFAVGIFAAC